MKKIRKVLNVLIWTAMVATVFVIVAINVQPEIRCLTPPPGMVSWWPGDGNADDIVNDNHGICEGGATFGPGLVGQAFKLDGVDDFINIPDSENLNVGTDDFTVDLWVNFESIEGEQVLIEKYIEVTLAPPPFPELNGWSLTKLDHNHIRFVGSPAWHNADFVPPPIPTNTWIFIAVTREGNNLTLYWNGDVIQTFYYAVTNLSCTSSLKLGHRGNPEDTPGSTDDRGFYLNGLIDEVEIYYRALSASEIKEIYNAGSKGKCKKIYATIDIDPNRLNLKSKGNWISCFIELLENHNVNDIDVSTIKISEIDYFKLSEEDQIFAEDYPAEINDYDYDGIQDLMVKFDREKLINILKDMNVEDGNKVEITVNGELKTGKFFEGSDIIKIKISF